VVATKTEAAQKVETAKAAPADMKKVADSKVEAVKTDAAVKTAEVKEATVAKAEEVKAAPAEAAVKAEKKGWFSWFKKSA